MKLHDHWDDDKKCWKEMWLCDTDLRHIDYSPKYHQYACSFWGRHENGTLAMDGTIYIFDAANGQLVKQTCLTSNIELWREGFHYSDGGEFIIIDGKETTKVYDAITFNLVAEYPGGPTDFDSETSHFYSIVRAGAAVQIHKWK